MYYLYDQNSVIAAKSDAQPTSGNYCTSPIDFDLVLNTVIVGAVDAKHNLTYYTIKAKPAEQLAAALKDTQAQVTAQAAAIAELSILIGGGS